MDENFTQLKSIVCQSPVLEPILNSWHKIALPDCWLVAGVLAQTVWNHQAGFSPSHGIADIDLVYFDADDLSERSENQTAARIRALFSNLPLWIDVKNEARVHLWYAGRFGYDIEPYESVSDAISTFPTTATSLGIRPAEGRWQCDAPFGLADLMQGIIRPNKTQASREVYEEKSTRWKSLWPHLSVLDWDHEK